MTAYITELDVLDPEKESWLVYVHCEECDDAGEALDMHRQWDGAWLCPTCDRNARLDFIEHQRYLNGLRGL